MFITPSNILVVFVSSNKLSCSASKLVLSVQDTFSPKVCGSPQHKLKFFVHFENLESHQNKVSYM